MVSGRFASSHSTSWIFSGIIASNILNGVARLKDVLRDVLNARAINLLGRSLHFKIIFHYVHDGSSAEVKNYSFVIVYLLRSLWNSESFSLSKSLSVIEQGFVEGVLKWFGEDLGPILLVWIIVVGETVEGMDAHETARSFWCVCPISAVFHALGGCHMVHIG
jgi:hypothetical protein